MSKAGIPWQRVKLGRADARGPNRWTADKSSDVVAPRPRSATFRPERFSEPEPMPEPENYRHRNE